MKLIRNLMVLIFLIAFILIINGKFYSSEGISFLTVYGITVTSVILLTFSIAHFKYKDPAIEIIEKNLNKNKKKPFVSCVLAVYNEEKHIEDCINSLINSTYLNKEIIVINDASTDNTLKILNNFKKNSKIKVLNLKKNIGKKGAIARGLKIAKGEIFVFTDSDCIVEKRAIDRIIQIFMYDKDVGAVSGHSRAWNSDKNIWTKIQDSWYEGQFSIKKALESSYGVVTCISGPLAVFRREAIFNFISAWEKDSFLGQEFKFATDRTLTAFVLGNEFIGNKLKKRYKNSWFVKSKDYPTKHWKTVYCKSAKVWTNVPDTFRKMIKQQIRWKKSFIRSIFLTGKFYWKKPIIPALLFYLKILFIFLGPFIVLRQLIYLPLSGNLLEPFLYLGGITFVGLTYGVFYKLENPNCHKWVYRPLMSLLSTLIISWFIFYSLFTIKNMRWHRG